MFIVTFPFFHQSDACNILLFMSNVYLELHLFFKLCSVASYEHK